MPLPSRSSVRRARRIGGLLGSVPAALLLAASCRPAPPPVSPAPASAVCAVGPTATRTAPSPAPHGRSAEAQPLVVAVTGRVEPAHAPAPRSPAERLVFAQLYQTLVGVGCGGEVEPLLAGSWQVEGDGLRWTFTLRPAVDDWDGRALSASDVAESWLALQETGAASGPHRFRRLDVLGPRTLLVELSEPAEAAFFARPELAVWTGSGEGGWPVGTGPFRPVDPPTGEPGAPLRLAGPASLEIRPLGGDPRDALDGGADLLVTSDPRAVEYARVAGTFETWPLAWDQGYLLVTPEEAQSASVASDARLVEGEGGSPRVLLGPSTALATLARDAVRAAARPATWTDRPCPASPSTARPARDVRDVRDGEALRIVYPAEDGVARALAERLIALALDPGRAEGAWLFRALPPLSAGAARPRAVGLREPAFSEALGGGRDAAYLVPVPRPPAADPCATLDALRGRAPWLHASGSLDGPLPTVVPLVETRATLVLARGVEGVTMDGNGVLRLDGVRAPLRDPGR